MTLDIKARKHALRLLHHNVAVVTSGLDDEIIGATVTWLMQSSFEPPLVTLAIKADSRLYTVIKRTGTLTVNLVEAGDTELASTFFKPRIFETDRMAHYPAKVNSVGGAMLDASPVCLSCEVQQIVTEGDHHLVVTEVVDVEVRSEDKKAMCLSDTDWHYGG